MRAATRNLLALGLVAVGVPAALAAALPGAGLAAAEGTTSTSLTTSTPASTTSTTSTTSATSTTTTLTTTTRRRRPAPTLYRVVGCASRGTIAYYHGPSRREVAIGFDDGPAADTPAFVTMLERNHVRATFFMIGEHVTAGFRGVLLRELRDGDVLGDHTYTHPDLVGNPQVRSQLSRTIAVIHGLTGYSPCVFRPPYGDIDAAVVQTARSLGLATVLWNVDPSDWALPGVAAIEQRVLAEVRPGSIIISHDGGGPRGETLAAYPAIIAALRRRGYAIVTIPTLLGFPPEYTVCRRRACDGLGRPRRALPRNAIIIG